MAPEIYSTVVVLACLALWALWLRRSAEPKRRLHVVETAALGQGRAVAVVRAGSKRLLIGVTGQSIATLAELDPEEWREADASAHLDSLETETP
jgi:flagellar biogenesis protein FliO